MANAYAGERPFHCRLCGNSFTTNGNMHRHMKTHQNDAGVDMRVLLGGDKKRRRRGGSARSGSPTDSQSLAHSQTRSMLTGGLEARDSGAVDTGLESESAAEEESCARVSVDSPRPAAASRGASASEDAADIPSLVTSVPSLLPPPRDPPVDEWQSLSITRTQSRVSNAFSISVLTSNSATTPSTSASASASSRVLSAVPAAPPSIASSAKSRSSVCSKRSPRQERAAAVKQSAAASKDPTRAPTPCSIDMKFRRGAAPVAVGADAPVSTPPTVVPLSSNSANTTPVLTSPSSESGATAKSDAAEVKPNAAVSEELLKWIAAALVASSQQTAAGAATPAASVQQQQQLSSVLSLLQSLPLQLQSLPMQSLLASAFANALSMNLVGLFANSAPSSTSAAPTCIAAAAASSAVSSASAADSMSPLTSKTDAGELKCASVALEDDKRSPSPPPEDEELKQSDDELKADLKSETTSGRKRSRTSTAASAAAAAAAAADNTIHPCKICGEQFPTLNAMRGARAIPQMMFYVYSSMMK